MLKACIAACIVCLVGFVLRGETKLCLRALRLRCRHGAWSGSLGSLRNVRKRNRFLPYKGQHFWCVLCSICQALSELCIFAVPAVILPLIFLMISAHPQPVDDCPCFEDAIAFVAVYGGISLSYWFLNSIPGFALVRSTVTRALPSHNTALVYGSVVLIAAIKIVIGVAAILVWRIVAKRILYGILPPLFRLVTPVFELPRRFYRTAPCVNRRLPRDQR